MRPFVWRRRAKRAAVVKAWYDSLTPEQQTAYHYRTYPHLRSDHPRTMHVELPPCPRDFL